MNVFITVLCYWKDNSKRFQILSCVARDALVLPASSGSIERCFSTATHILTAKLAGMKEDLFANIMLIKCNERLNDTTK